MKVISFVLAHRVDRFLLSFRRHVTRCTRVSQSTTGMQQTSATSWRPTRLVPAPSECASTPPSCVARPTTRRRGPRTMSGAVSETVLETSNTGRLRLLIFLMQALLLLLNTSLTGAPVCLCLCVLFTHVASLL